MVRVPQTTQNLVISRLNKSAKIYNARAQLLFCSLNLLFGVVLVAVVVVVCVKFLDVFRWCLDGLSVDELVTKPYWLVKVVKLVLFIHLSDWYGLVGVLWVVTQRLS